MRKISKISLLVFIICLAFLGLFACDNSLRENENGDFVTVSDDTFNDNSLFTRLKQIESVNENYVADNDYLNGKKGILITGLSNNSSLIYKYAIDIDEIQNSLIEFEILRNDDYQATSVEISVIDIYDENNYVSVLFTNNETNDAWTTVTAKNCIAMQYLGYDNRESNQTSSSGYTYYYNNFNCLENKNVITYPFNFYVDGENGIIKTKVNKYEYEELLNLRDLSVFDKNTSFKGFTSNQVYLKIEFKNLIKKGGLLITKIGNKSYDELINRTLINDNIKFLDGKHNGSLHLGCVGYEYNLPKPIENDFLLGKTYVELSVKKGSENVAFDDYSFVPSKSGNYTATYSYKDCFKNEVELVYDFTVNDNPNEITVLFEEKEYTIGDTAHLPSVTANGGSGKLTVETEYLYNTEKIEKDNFLLKKSGKIIVKTTVTDEIGYTKNEKKEYAIDNKRLITLKGTIPSVAVKNGYLYLPDFDAYDYFTNEQMTKSIYVNGNKLNGLSYSVTENEGDNLNIVYYGNKNETTETQQSFLITVINPSVKDDLSGYFIYDKEELFGKTGENYTTFTAKKDLNQTSLKYGYPISANNALISIKFDKFLSNFSYLEFNLTDYIDSTNAIKFRITFDEVMFLNLTNENGEYGKEKVISSKMAYDDEFTIYFNNKNRQLLNYQFGILDTIPYEINGNEFKGFKNGAFILEIIAKEISEGSTINVKDISNQSFTSFYYTEGDTTAPAYYLFGSLPSKTEINEKVLLPKAYGFDVLSGPCDVLLSVTYPTTRSKNITQKVMNEETEIIFDEYGKYSVLVECTDKNGNLSRARYYVTVIDRVPPEIQVNGEVFGKVKVNKQITLPSVIATDNCTESDELESIVIISNGLTDEILSPNDKYTFKKEGNYTVTYVVKDETDNYSIKTFNVKVTR